MSADDGRTYHSTSAPYSLPNDASEHQRLELQTAAIDHMMGQASHAPISNPQRILEVGCGTGVTTRLFAKLYPQAKEIIGLDLSPVPQPSPLPPNLSFIQGDFRELAAHTRISDGGFDYVFSRMLVYGMTDFPDYIRRCRDLLSPGGWLELQEPSIDYFDLNKTRFEFGWLREQTEAWAKRGLDMQCGPKLAGYMREAGFVDVCVRVSLDFCCEVGGYVDFGKEFRWMFGPWEGHPETDRIAAYTARYIPDANFGAFKKVLGPSKTPDELAKIEIDMLRDMSYSEDGKHFPFFAVYGRRS